MFFFFEHKWIYIHVCVCMIILHMRWFSFYNNSNSPWKLITYLYFTSTVMFCIFPNTPQSFFSKPSASSVTSRSQAVHRRPVRRSFELYSQPQFDFHVSKPCFPGTSNVGFFYLFVLFHENTKIWCFSTFPNNNNNNNIGAASIYWKPRRSVSKDIRFVRQPLHNAQ